jgi:hypothetical protein
MGNAHGSESIESSQTKETGSGERRAVWDAGTEWAMCLGHTSLCSSFPLLLYIAGLSPLPRRWAEVPQCDRPLPPSAMWPHFPPCRPMSPNLHSCHCQFPGPTLILGAIDCLANRKERPLGLGDVRMQGLLLPQRKGLSESPFLKWFPSMSPVSKLGGVGDPPLVSACCVGWRPHIRNYFCRLLDGIPMDISEAFLFSFA